MDKNELISDVTTPKTKAIHKPESSNPGTIYAVNQIIPALITRVNSPRVKILIGKVKNTKTGFTKKFKTPVTIETIKAVTTVSTTTPGRI